MKLEEVMHELESMGTAQNRKIYKRHGAGDKLFGVSFANLNKLKKKIKVDHELAMKLWDTGNPDAQTFAIMIADPSKLTETEVDHWVNDVHYYILGNLLGDLIAKTDFAQNKMNQWMSSSKEYIRQCGYSILSSFLKYGGEVSDSDLTKYLTAIEKEIHQSPNRAREAMNYALIAIGSYKLANEAITTAIKIGPVEINHGETSCKTPDAVNYIVKVQSRARSKKKE
jgi:3-methyladenine DNA glycosylase AlkD